MNAILKWALIIIATPIVIVILLNIGSNIYFHFIPKLKNPSGKIFVNKGDRFKVLEDIKTNADTSWKAPYSGSFKCVIPKGTILIAPYQGLPDVRGFACIPEDYEKFENEYVPIEIREHEKYDGYSFTLLYRDIGKKVVLINDNSQSE